jgi:hypothetical protein
MAGNIPILKGNGILGQSAYSPAVAMGKGKGLSPCAVMDYNLHHFTNYGAYSSGNLLWCRIGFQIADFLC